MQGQNHWPHRGENIRVVREDRISTTLLPYFFVAYHTAIMWRMVRLIIIAKSGPTLMSAKQFYVFQFLSLSLTHPLMLKVKWVCECFTSLDVITFLLGASREFLSKKWCCENFNVSFCLLFLIIIFFAQKLLLAHIHTQSRISKNFFLQSKIKTYVNSSLIIVDNS
jgi:hypothetical protein